MLKMKKFVKFEFLIYVQYVTTGHP